MRVREFVLALMVMIIISEFAYAESYSQAEENDYGVYLYFNTMLEEFNSVLNDILGSENGTTPAESFYLLTNITVEDAVKYNSLGIRPSVLELAYYFKSLGENVYALALNQRNFIESLEKGDSLEARANLFSMKASLDDIYTNLAYISEVSLVNEKGEVLNFNLAGIYGDLEKVHERIQKYEEMLNRVSSPVGFLLFSSKESPFVHENVTFYGYTLGLENISVVINNVSYSPKIVNDEFKLRYSFNKTGIYEAYARALNGSEVIVSNILYIHVQKIPTHIIATENTGVSVTVEGHLIDDFGNYLPGKIIVLEMDGERYTSQTGENGTFIFELREIFESKNATISFVGDDMHKESTATLTLIPLKKRLTIRLFFEEDEVREGESVRISGYINGTAGRIPLEVYIDDKLTNTMNAEGNFTLFLRFEKGKHCVYVRFPGNDEFAESVSNIVEINVVPYNYTERALAFFVLLILGVLTYRFLTRKPKVEVIQTKPREVPVEILKGEEEIDPIKSYRFLYSFLRRLYHLPKSITPRELLRRFENENFAFELRKATVIHEKGFYGKKRLGAREIVEGIRSVASTIVKVFVREEL